MKKFIVKYRELKLIIKGAFRKLAKLFLNQLYGKIVMSPYNLFKVANTTKNYYYVNDRGFTYADTDSVHCDLLPDEMR